MFLTQEQIRNMQIITEFKPAIFKLTAQENHMSEHSKYKTGDRFYYLNWLRKEEKRLKKDGIECGIHKKIGSKTGKGYQNVYALARNGINL